MFTKHRFLVALLLGVIIISIITACASPTPELVMVEVTQVVVATPTSASLEPTEAPVSTQPPTAKTVPLFFSDNFSTDKDWINETSGHFYRDTTNEWLSWHIHRSTDEKYYIPIGPYSGEFRLEARLKAIDWANNCDFYFGLVEDINGSWPTGSFVSFGWFGAGVGNRVVPRIVFSDGSPSVGWDADDSSTYINYDLNRWYRIVFEVVRGTWAITVYDDSDNRVDQLSGAMPSAHTEYRYLVLFNPYDGDWPTGDGLLDDLVVESIMATTPPVHEETPVPSSVPPTSIPELPKPTPELPTSTPAPTVTPTPEPVARHRVIMLRNKTYMPQFTKLEGVAFGNGIDFTIYPSSYDFFEDLESSDVAAAVYMEAYPDAEVLNHLYPFIRNGGHVLMMYQYGWHRENGILQDLYGVSVATEFVVKVDSNNLRYPDSMIPSWLRGLSVGYTSAYDRNAIRAYLVSTKDGEKAYATSQESGKDRLMVVEYMMGEGKVIFWPQGYGVSSTTPDWDESCYIKHFCSFWSDDSIDLYDNEEAAIRMLQHLQE